ncbi:hypothetical protein E5288_WYG009287 [Bos mutus]|uniref:Uncharacterized protein n=1 Tax=Bos mutus TaxID=72004 RepID=A0A6B0S0F8_9CETA|nr:hypothetical protein [Bos mutus]
MTHHEILSKELFNEFYASTFSDYPSDMYTSVSEDDGFSEFSSDSDNVIIRLTQRQKTLVIDSDMESENETHGAGAYAFASTEEKAKDISRKTEDFTEEMNSLKRRLIRKSNLSSLILKSYTLKLSPPRITMRKMIVINVVYSHRFTIWRYQDPEKKEQCSKGLPADSGMDKRREDQWAVGPIRYSDLQPVEANLKETKLVVISASDSLQGKECRKTLATFVINNNSKPCVSEKLFNNALLPNDLTNKTGIDEFQFRLKISLPKGKLFHQNSALSAVLLIPPEINYPMHRFVIKEIANCYFNCKQL